MPIARRRNRQLKEAVSITAMELCGSLRSISGFLASWATGFSLHRNRPQDHRRLMTPNRKGRSKRPSTEHTIVSAMGLNLATPIRCKMTLPCPHLRYLVHVSSASSSTAFRPSATIHAMASNDHIFNARIPLQAWLPKEKETLKKAGAVCIRRWRSAVAEGDQQGSVVVSCVQGRRVIAYFWIKQSRFDRSRWPSVNSEWLP
jgi:hypothetical protein